MSMIVAEQHQGIGQAHIDDASALVSHVVFGLINA